MIRVLIADDQEMIRQSLSIVLGAFEDIEVTGTAANGREVISQVQANKPDVVLMDIRMPGMDGVQCTRVLREHDPSLHILVLTTFDDDEYVFNALKYGACGYLLKGDPPAELVEAIRTAAAGGSVIHPAVASKVVQQFSRMAQTDLRVEVSQKQSADLNATERRIVCQVGRGMSNKEIAQKLGLSEGTVRNALSACLSKLGLRDRTQLAIWAVQTGIAGDQL